MITTLLNRISTLLTKREIERTSGEKYLTRYRIFGFMPGDSDTHYPINIYLHRIHTEDEDQFLHSHPWKWAISIILTGWYEEIRIIKHDGTSILAIDVTRCRYFNHFYHSTYHHILRVSEKPVWTLLITGPRISSWGFFVPGKGNIPWRTRLKERGITPAY